MYRLIAFTTIMFVTYGIVGANDFEDAKDYADNYCDMVKLYKESGGLKGWPAFNSEAVCADK